MVVNQENVGVKDHPLIPRPSELLAGLRNARELYELLHSLVGEGWGGTYSLSCVSSAKLGVGCCSYTGEH